MFGGFSVIDKLQLYDERIEMMKSAVERKQTKRVPVFAQTDNWALFYYGTTLKAALNDPKLEYAAYAKALTDFPFDASAFCGITTPASFISSLGGGMYQNNTETLQIQTGKSEVMPPQDYNRLIEDPVGYLTNVILPKKFEIFRKGSAFGIFGKLAKSMGKMNTWSQDKDKAMNAFKTEHGLPILNAVPPFIAADILLDGLRDFKGIMSDIKRMPDLVADACMALTKEICIPGAKFALPEPSDERYMQFYMHLPPWIKPKDFEKVYWPSYKLYIDTLANEGYKMIIFFEKNYSHLYDYLQDLPKNCILGLFEEDDLCEVKKALGGTMCIGGGIRTNDLQFKTASECVDITKKLIDDLAPGGGYVFSTHKILLSMNDAKPENLQAVTEYVKENAMY